MLEYEISLEAMSSFVLSLAMVVIGTGFFVGFTVKKMLQFLKSF